jgi:hypothetical protein
LGDIGREKIQKSPKFAFTPLNRLPTINWSI